MPPDSNIPDIDDITPPMEIPDSGNLTLWIVLGAALILVLLVAITLMIRTPARRSASRDYDARKSALDKLHRLKEEATTTSPGQCALITTAALKEYLFDYHDPNSPFSTTPEILANLHKKGTSSDILEQIKELLTQADALKYARSESDVNLRLPLIESAIRFLREDKSSTAPFAKEKEQADEQAFI